jgi:hypothetical protein
MDLKILFLFQHISFEILVNLDLTIKSIRNIFLVNFPLQVILLVLILSCVSFQKTWNLSKVPMMPRIHQLNILIEMER